MVLQFTSHVLTHLSKMEKSKDPYVQLVILFALSRFKCLQLLSFGLKRSSHFYTLILLPTTTFSFKTPFEVLFGLFPKYDHLCVFECLCYPNTSSTSPQKLSPRFSGCVYLGPAIDQKGHKYLYLMTQRVIISRHVVFDEDHFPYCDFHFAPSDSDYNQITLDDDPPSPFPLTRVPLQPSMWPSSLSSSSSYYYYFSSSSSSH